MTKPSLTEVEQSLIDRIAAVETATGEGADYAALRDALPSENPPGTARATLRTILGGLQPQYVASDAPATLTLEGWLASSSAAVFTRAVSHYLAVFAKAVSTPGATRDQYTWAALVEHGADAARLHLYLRVGSLMRLIHGSARERENFRAGYPADAETLVELQSTESVIRLRRRQERESRVASRILTEETAKALSIIYSMFSVQSEWPLARDVDIAAWHAGMRLVEVLSGNQSLAVLGDPREPNAKATLTLIGLATLEAAEEDCELVARFVRALAAHYVSSPAVRRVRAGDISRDAQINGEQLARVVSILAVQGAPVAPVRVPREGTKTEATFELSHDLLRCASARSIDEMISVLQQSNWSPTRDAYAQWMETEQESTVFYSWQTDLPARGNRSMIGTALEKAIKRLVHEADLVAAPRVDQATSGLPGAPAIADAILDKIRAASAFVADVSIIGSTGKRWVCNPNVLYELGFAVAHLGWDKIVLVANTAYGDLEQLPFDLRGRRVSRYQFKEEDEAPKSARDALVTALTEQLSIIFGES